MDNKKELQDEQLDQVSGGTQAGNLLFTGKAVKPVTTVQKGAAPKAGSLVWREVKQVSVNTDVALQLEEKRQLLEEKRQLLDEQLGQVSGGVVVVTGSAPNDADKETDTVSCPFPAPTPVRSDATDPVSEKNIII